MKLWGTRFTKKTDREVEAFTSSISFDKKLYRYDIRGSIAHAKMLSKCGLISREEASKITEGLEEIGLEIQEGRLEFKEELEDIHTHIEARLREKIGDAAGKLHTARSRNDQVALDTRLYLRDEVKEIIGLVIKMQKAIVGVAQENIEAIMPGFTHLQPAEPVLFSHYLMAYFWMLQRDRERFKEGMARINVMPLGAGALAGTSLPIDREYVAGELNFPGVTENSIDTVSDRDYIIEFTSAASILMMHLSRLSEELILFANPAFGFLEVDETFCTGSSLMPQKKNLDVAELVRGKTGRIYGHLIGLLTMMKALPLSYNRDMQEDKEPLFDTVTTVKESLNLFAKMIGTLRIDKERMLSQAFIGSMWATELANYLVRKGLPFREAHQIVGQIVACEDKEITLALLKKHSGEFDCDALSFLDPEEVVKAKVSYGSTSLDQVREQIKKAKEIVDEE
ncbi:argininosuccinate lyase [bacterium]|nr:argininosuccinate lyase [bacterium]MBU1615418.1 argininosuccinate lyase [bacterium]